VAGQLDDPGFYCVIHIVHWAKETEKNPQKTDQQNWCLYNGGKTCTREDFKTNKRLFGVKHPALVYIYLNKNEAVAPDVRYEIRCRLLCHCI
jgi:hypothetical protein